jgi:alpha-galactosidase
MWAILNSPLLIGADLRTLSPSALTILNNPAVIAINQDPLAKSAIRISRNTKVAKDEYEMGETQIWSGKLWGGDQVVAFLNAADEDVEMKATLKEIFIREAGKAPQVEETWDIYDLWAGRMKEEVAKKVLDSEGGAQAKILKDVGWYNATEVSYEAGIKSGDPRILGTKISSVKPHGVLKTKVKKHSVEVFRLRSPSKETSRENVLEDKIDEEHAHGEL